MQENTKAVDNFESTKNDECGFEKGHTQPDKKDIIKINPTKEQDTNKENILPEYMVYVNHNNFQDAGRL